MKYLGQVIDEYDVANKKYVDGQIPESLPANGGNSSTVNNHTVEKNVPSDAVFTDTVYTHPTTHDLSMITDLNSDNVFSGNSKINRLMYFKNNNISNISQVYKTGFYGTTKTDTTTPYAGYWFVAVFCKDETNQIAIQWAMDVSKSHNGELWMRTVRLNAASTGDGNLIGTWKKIGGAEIPLSATQPLSPSIGDYWYKIL